MCVCLHCGNCDLPDPSEDAVQIFLHLYECAGVEQEALVHLLQSYIRQPVEVDQHFIGFFKAIEPVFTIIQQIIFHHKSKAASLSHASEVSYARQITYFILSNMK